MSVITILLSDQAVKGFCKNVVPLLNACGVNLSDDIDDSKSWLIDHLNTSVSVWTAAINTPAVGNHYKIPKRWDKSKPVKLDGFKARVYNKPDEFTDKHRFEITHVNGLRAVATVTDQPPSEANRTESLDVLMFSFLGITAMAIPLEGFATAVISDIWADERLLDIFQIQRPETLCTDNGFKFYSMGEDTYEYIWGIEEEDFIYSRSYAIHDQWSGLFFKYKTNLQQKHFPKPLAYSDIFISNNQQIPQITKDDRIISTTISKIIKRQEPLAKQKEALDNLADKWRTITTCLERKRDANKTLPAGSFEIDTPEATTERKHSKVIYKFNIAKHAPWLKKKELPFPLQSRLVLFTEDKELILDEHYICLRSVDFKKRIVLLEFPNEISVDGIPQKLHIAQDIPGSSEARLISAMEQWIARGNYRNPLFQSMAYKLTREGIPDVPTKSNLLPKQKEAFDAGLSANPLSLIKGPPGTGKTTVIAEIIKKTVDCSYSQGFFLYRQNG